MKQLSLKICLMIAALFWSVGLGFALPQCHPLLYYNYDKWLGYKECFGKKFYSDNSYFEGRFRWMSVKEREAALGREKIRQEIVAAAKFRLNLNRPRYTAHGQGIYKHEGTVYEGNYTAGYRQGFGTLTEANGTVVHGIWKLDKFQYATKISSLQTAFKELSQKQRKLIQSNLKDLNFYKSYIDGLDSQKTAGALTKYNREFLGNFDLEKTETIEKLISTVLALKPVSVLNPIAKLDDIYNVASGTGFYVSEEGHIITNHHVIDGCEHIKLHSKGEALKTKKIAEDKRNDLALLKISVPPRHAFALSAESPFPLQNIVVAGYPFGERVSSTLKFTQGIVSSMAGMGDDYSQIQIDAAIQPGNSGGPILDKYGNVVAVAVAKLSLKKILKDYGVVPENTNFGVKASAVRNLMEGNGVPFKSPNTEVISKRELSQIATDGTVYLTCWMTTAQIEQMRARKVLFEDLE